MEYRGSIVPANERLPNDTQNNHFSFAIFLSLVRKESDSHRLRIPDSHSDGRNISTVFAYRRI